MEIQVPPLNSHGQWWMLINESGVRYKSSDLDTLIRYFVNHTERKAVQLITNKNQNETSTE